MFERLVFLSRKRPVRWCPPTGRSRVLVENPDVVEAFEQVQALRRAGFEAAVCFGPERDRRAVRCPILKGKSCALVDGADAIVTTANIRHSARIRSALIAGGKRPVVAEEIGRSVPTLEAAVAAVIDART